MFQINDESGTLLSRNLAETFKVDCLQCRISTNPIVGSPCKVRELLEGIGELGSMLLTLSLFGPHPQAFPMLKAGRMFDTVSSHYRIYPQRRTQVISSPSFSKLITALWQALMHGQCAYLSCPPIAIFQHAAKMMGHQRIRDSTIISSLHGQVLFPAFFEARDFLSEGFLQMSAFPGKLQKGEMQFDFLLDSWSNTLDTAEVSDTESEEFDSYPAGEGHDHDERRDSNNESQDRPNSVLVKNKDFKAHSPVTKPVSASFVGTRRRLVLSAEVMKWRISVRDTMLHGELSLQDDGVMVIAWSLIESLARVRLSPSCPHPYNNPAGELADTFELAPDPISANLRGHLRQSRSVIVAGQSYADQLDALQNLDSYPPVIVHVDGCIRCAMRLGLADRMRVVIS